MRLVLRLVLVPILLVVLYVAGALLGLYGDERGAGEPTAARIPGKVVQERVAAQRQAAAARGVGSPKQILFGDLHVHTTFSTEDRKSVV